MTRACRTHIFTPQDDLWGRAIGESKGCPGALEGWDVGWARGPGCLALLYRSPDVWIPCVWGWGETREPRHQGPLCVGVIYGDQGDLVGFVMILWVSDAWVSCV